MKKLTHEDYLKRLKDKESRVVPIDQYISMGKNIKHKCTCGEEWNLDPANILKGGVCPECTKVRKSLKLKDAHRWTEEKFIYALKERNAKVKYVSGFITVNERALFICKCGRRWDTRCQGPLNGETCWECANDKKRSIPKDQRPDYFLYYEQVRRYTNKNDLKSLENFDKRGRSKRGSKAYNLDHKFSTMEGFKRGILPSIIGSIHNLKMIPYEENISKLDKCSISEEELIGNFVRTP